MSDNWLSTAGSWLATPAKVVFGPWWDKHIESKAESIAVRKKVLEAVVHFRVHDFCKGRNVDADKELGIARRIVERLAAVLTADKTTDPTSSDFLNRIQQEVHLHGVPETAWMQLACLAATGDFDSRNVVIVEFTDEKGNQSHGSTTIASLQASFPFWKVFHLRNLTIGNVSPEALSGLSEYANRHVLPEVRYEITSQMPELGQLSGNNISVLPPAWRPNRNE